MSTFKRIISFLLAVVMLVGMLPAGATAAETNVNAGETSIESTNSLGALLSEEIQTQQEASAVANEEYDEGFSVTDLTFSGATATVTYDAVEEATLVVAVYTEDGKTLLNSAYTQVTPGQTQATVTLEGEIPQYFAASAYLLNTYDMAPLCPAYDTPVYTQSMQELLSSTVEDYPADRVLNLDEDNTTNFAVYAEDTVVVEEKSGVNTVISADDETMTYVIGNADQQFTSLKKGNVVVYPYGDNQYIIVKVAKISVSGTTVTISGGELEVEDVFSHVKIEGDSSNVEYTYDASTLSEGLTIDNGIHPSASATEDDPIEISKAFSKKFKLFESDGAHIDAQGTLEFTMQVSLKYYKVEDVHFLEFRDNASITYNVKYAAEYSAKKNLGKVGAKFLGGIVFVGFDPAIHLNAEAEAEFTAVVRASVGILADSASGIQNISTPPSATYDLRVEGSIYLGLDLNPTIEVFGGYAVDGDLTLAIGIRIDGELTGGITEGEIGGILAEPEDTIHTCEVCFAFDGYCQLNFQASIAFVKVLKFSTKDRQKDLHLGSWYYSVDHEEFDKGKCPYESYRVAIEVLDHVGTPVAGATVTATPSEGESKSGSTNANGILFLHLPLEYYEIRAVSGELARTVRTGIAEPRKVTITLPEPDEPEGTEPAGPGLPGGILDGGDTPPVVNYGTPKYTGYFELSDDFTWAYYPGPNDDYYHDTIVVYGTGEFTKDIWDSGVYYTEEYDYDFEQWVPIRHEIFAPWKLVIGEGITAVSGIFSHSVDSEGFRQYLEYVSLPSTLTKIGDKAFYYSHIKEITIPDSVTHIGESAFEGCAFLKEIVIPRNVISIGEYAFSRCGFTRVVIEEGVTHLGGYGLSGYPDNYFWSWRIFFDCDNLVSVELPNTLKKLGNGTFYNCGNLCKITIPDSVEEIGSSTFSGTGLVHVEIPRNVKEVSGFDGCTKLESVTINSGDDWIRIEDYAFEGCTSLQSIELPENTLQIGNSAFKGCTSLTRISIPENGGDIWPDAFYNCTNLREVIFEGVDLTDGYTYQITIMGRAFGNCSSLTSINIPGVEELWGNAFIGCTSLESVFLDGGVAFFYPHDDWSENGDQEWDEDAAVDEAFPELTATVYYPWYCYDDPYWVYPSDSTLSRVKMKQMGSHITWIPYETNEDGTIAPIEEWAYRPWEDAEETEEAESAQAETVPAVTEPAVAETTPAETVPETIHEETAPAETVPAETTPQVTEPVETVPVETFPTETEPEETASFVTVALPSAAAANVFRVSNSRTELRALSNDEILVGEEITAPALDALFGGDYSSEVTENKTVKTASFSGLVPGEEYLLLALTTLETSDPLSIGNLIHIDQGTAAEEGTLSFSYVERQDFSISYVMVSGPSNKHLKDATITFPKVYASDGEQVIQPTVKYDGKTLTEGKDYVLSGKVAFSTAGTYTCYIRGIYNYAGVVECTYTVAEKPLPQIRIKGNDSMSAGSITQLSASFSKKPEGEAEILWSLAEGDEQWAELRAEGEYAYIIAFAADEEHTITVTASCLGKADPAEKKITIYPSESEVLTEELKIYELVWNDYGELESQVDLSTKAVWQKMLADILVDPYVYLTAEAYPEGANWDVYWTSSDEDVAKIDVYGGVYFTGNPGKVTITTEALDGTGVKASVTYEVVACNHTFGKWTQILAPNCDTEGQESRTCKTCGSVETRPISALGHDMIFDKEVPPTCTEPGYQAGAHCSRCDYTEGRAEIPALGHSEVTDAAVAPTCAKAGLTEGSHCEACGVIIVAQEGIPATGHSFENGFCLICGESDKADFDLFAGKSLTLKPINPDTGKAYTAKQLTWTIDEAYEPFVKLSKGKVTAQKVVEKARVEVVATVVATGEELCYSIDVYPAVTQLEVMRDGDIVNGKTILMDFADETLVLKADAYPVDTLENVTWTVSDKKAQYAEYTIDGDTLTISNPKNKAGTVTIKATVDAGVKKNVTVKVSFGSFAKAVEIEAPEKTSLRGGESLTLKAAITDPSAVSKPGILWTTSNKAAATVSNGKVTAKNVAHPMLVTITATSKDGQAYDSVKLKIIPKNEGQLVLMHDGAYATNSTVTLNAGETRQITASSIVDGDPAVESVTWSSSKAAVATVADGLITAVGAGSAKITATASDGRKAVINVKVTTLVSDMTISTKDGKNLVTENGETLVEIASSKGATLAAAVYPAKANKSVTWEIVEGAAYAKISSSGKITANKDLTSVKYVTVKATAKDGSGYSETIRVRIRPLATGVQIYSQQNGVTTFSIRTPENWWVRSNTTLTVDLDETGSMQLLSHVYPYYGEDNDRNAIQGATWKSSNAKIASIDADGNVTFLKTGTVTITATAKDGSGKKVTFKLKIV